MINMVLQKAQNQMQLLPREDVNALLDFTLSIRGNYKAIEGIDYIINACVPFVKDYRERLEEKLPVIINDNIIKGTLLKSPATTSNVNNRLSRVKEIINE